jgi:putative iron-regulated protein
MPSTAKTLQTAIDAFLAKPNAETLKAAKEAWVAARVPYLQSEVFRFGNTIIDDWEGQVNAWPLDEGLIDYVDKSYEHALGNPAPAPTSSPTPKSRSAKTRSTSRTSPRKNWPA